MYTHFAYAIVKEKNGAIVTEAGKRLLIYSRLKRAKECILQPGEKVVRVMIEQTDLSESYMKRMGKKVEKKTKSVGFGHKPLR